MLPGPAKPRLTLEPDLSAAGMDRLVPHNMMQVTLHHTRNTHYNKFVSYFFSRVSMSLQSFHL